MSININIEIGGGLAKVEIFRTLPEMGFIFSSEDAGSAMEYIGYFPESGMRLLYVDEKMDNWREFSAGNVALTDDARFSTWSIGARLSFCYRESDSELCDTEIRAFVNKLAKFSRAYFVLSFEYEKVYAVKDVNGLEWENFAL